MKKILVVFVLLLLIHYGNAQRSYFIYLQTENNQPFFVKMNERIYSSTATGFLILPKLNDTTHTFSFGFPNVDNNDDQFNCTINHKDRGLLIKNFGAEGWGLFDLQSLAVIKPLRIAQTALASGSQIKVEKREANPFTDMLSKATKDTSLYNKITIIEPEKKKESVMVVKETVSEVPDSVITSKDIAMAPVDSVKPPAETINLKDSVVTLEEKLKSVVNAGIVKKESVQDTILKEKTIIQEPIAKKENTVEKQNDNIASDKEKKPDTVAVEIARKEEPVIVKAPELPKKEIPLEEKIVKPVEQEKTPAVKDIFTRSKVTKKSESSTTEGFGLVYVDELTNGIKDTIRILIPNPKQTVRIQEETKAPTPAPVSAGKKEPEPRFLEVGIINEKADTSNKKIREANTETVKDKTNKCVLAANEKDFLELRKNMASATSEDGMIEEAKKYFKKKCFNVQYIKNLGSLFLTEEGRYNFYDAAYKYTTDAANFPSLESELADEYFKNRFRAMLK